VLQNPDSILLYQGVQTRSLIYKGAQTPLQRSPDSFTHTKESSLLHKEVPNPLQRVWTPGLLCILLPRSPDSLTRISAATKQNFVPYNKNVANNTSFTTQSAKDSRLLSKGVWTPLCGDVFICVGVWVWVCVWVPACVSV
jgi:hypothetical protein